jgi:hypothetical protein
VHYSTQALHFSLVSRGVKILRITVCFCVSVL